MRSPLLVLAVVALLGGAVSVARGADQATPGGGPEWLAGLTLVVLDSDDVGSLHAAHALIRSQGGTIALLSPPSLLIGWIPPEKNAALLGRAHIRAIHRRPVSSSGLGIEDASSQRMVEFFNAAVRGDLRRPAELQKPGAWPQGTSDALPPEPLEPWAYLQNLQANGLDPGQLAARGLLVGKAGPDASIEGNSDRMTGTVTVTILFVESDGTGADPNQYTWTPADVQNYVNGVNVGLAWWSAQAQQNNNCWVAFFVRWVEPTDARCRQWREMVLHPSGDVAAMASDVMAKFGYNSGTHTTRVTAFNTAQRATYGTNWAYTSFVAYNPEPAAGQLTDGRSAFAYLLGPYSFLLFRSYGWRPDEVFTHESGHIFGACDEYASGCTCGTLCIDQPNGNCEACGGGVSCMMRANTFTLCTYTDDQVGWQDAVPCAPPPLTPPTATAVLPAFAYQGTTLQVTIAGNNLLYGAFAEFGDGVALVSSSVVGDDSLKLNLQIGNDATPGLRNVVVKNRDLQSSMLVNAFQIRTTTRHYYASSGSNVFPYHTPATAATTLGAAIDAAAPGDTVLLRSGTLPFGSLVLNKGVLLSGAWNTGFTARNLATGKTVIDLTGNVYIAVTGSGTGGLDGFELRNGSGGAWNTPVSGHYGGAVSIVSSTGLVANCDIHSNHATTFADFGGGGGLFASNSTVTLTGNTIHDNTATRGGGIYLYGSSGTVTGNTINANVVSAGPQTARGAGIVLDTCSNLTLGNNVIDGNTGAESGGGLYVINSSTVSVQGGSIAHHTVTSSGGGVRLEASQVDFQDVRLAHNASSFSEGALAAVNSSALLLDGCEVLWNSSAFLYAGVHATGPTAHVRHSLFVGNSSLVGGAGLMLENVTSGAVTGNTFDRNSAGNGAGSLGLNAAAIPVSNNIVVNTTGTGVGCTGAQPTLLAYNLAWNNSTANYSGCSPGAGSIGGDPRFADTTLVNYRLQVHSPAIDAGRTDAGFEDPDGSRGDLGRYGSHAFVMAQPSYPKNLTAQTQGGHIVLRWRRNPEADVAFYAVYCDSSSGFAPSAANFVTSVASPDTTVDLGPPGTCDNYTVSAVDTDGYASGYAAKAQLSPPTDSPLPVAWRFRLQPSVPNPFNPTTTIRFELEHVAPVRLEIFDLTGRLVRTLLQGTQGAGAHGILWDGRDGRGERVPSGVYLLRLQSEGRALSQKLAVLK
ncbi:MAG TPA: right-handed parallel beta-helix repeat-containing protein [Candidatus Krumholzibacteria bacterium]|nr:right-handed parallel beta-helix repeat-containing protein [Candidatus Krumholzibacteria bacterium]